MSGGVRSQIQAQSLFMTYVYARDHWQEKRSWGVKEDLCLLCPLPTAMRRKICSNSSQPFVPSTLFHPYPHYYFKLADNHLAYPHVGNPWASLPELCLSH